MKKLRDFAIRVFHPDAWWLLQFPETWPDDDEALTMLTKIASASDEERPPLLGQAISRWPTCALWYILSALMHRYQAEAVQARADLATALALDPSNPLPYRLLGYILRDQGHAKLAQDVLERGWDMYKRTPFIPRDEEERKKFFGDDHISEQDILQGVNQ